MSKAIVFTKKTSLTQSFGLLLWFHIYAACLPWSCFLQATVHLPYKRVKLLGFPVYRTHVLHCQEQSHYASLLSKELYRLFLSLQNKPSWSCDWILPECGPTRASPSLFPIPRWFTCILFLTVISPPISICPILFFEVMKSLFFTSLGSTNCLVLCLYNLWLMLTGHQHMVGSLSKGPRFWATGSWGKNCSHSSF